MYILLIMVHVFVCLVLILVILLQAGLALVVSVTECVLRLDIRLLGPGAQFFEVRAGLGPARQPAQPGEQHRAGQHPALLFGDLKASWRNGIRHALR